MQKVVPSEVINYIDSRYPEVLNELKGKHKGWSLTEYDIASVTTVLMMVDAIPKHLIMFEGNAAAEFNEAVETIRFAVSLWNAGNKTHYVSTIPGRGGLNTLTILRKQLESLHDEGIEPTTNELLFIKDPTFRESLRRDLGAVNRSFDNCEWKAATVLGGSVVEAFLLNAIREYEMNNPAKIQKEIKKLRASHILQKQPPSDLEKWVLYELTEVAFAVSLIMDNTAAQCRIARNFRNLIHPGMAARLAQECNRATTLSALAAVEHVVQDLAP